MNVGLTPSPPAVKAEPARPARHGSSADWGRRAVAVSLLGVTALLGLFGAKMAGDAGWFRGGGAGGGGTPGIFTRGQVVSTAFRQAPDFTLQLFSGPSLRLDELRGGPVMVNFWASWCPPCREEAPLLERTWRAYRDRGVTFIGIDIWDTEQDARKFLKDFDITYPNGPDPGQTALDYGLTGIPETFFVDRGGLVLRKWIGPFTEAPLRAFLDELLASSGEGG